MDIAQDQMAPKRNGESAATNTSSGRVTKSIVVVAAVRQPLLLRGIAGLLDQAGDIELAAGVASAADAINAIEKYEPDVALLSQRLRGQSALAVIEAMAKKDLPTRVVLIAADLSVSEFQEIMRFGVHGVYAEDMPEALLLRCVRAVYAGNDFFENETVLRAFGAVLRQGSTQPEFTKMLTARERAVAEQVARGLSNKEIGRRLGLTEGTVKSHLHRVYFKLRVRSRFSLMKINDRQTADQA